MSGAVAVVVAAGRGTRLGGAVPKAFVPIDGRPLVERSVEALLACPEVAAAVVVVAPEEIGGTRARAAGALPGVSAVVAGGSTRLLSSLAGVEAAVGAEVVLVHDAARPFVRVATIAAVLDAVRRHGAAVPVIPVPDTVKQTPQGARRALLLDALRKAAADGIDVTDEAQALERAGFPVAAVAGDPGNVKITTPRDRDEAERRISGEAHDLLRIGHGYDIHRFGGGRPLILGGVLFDGEPGLSGHSDADVVLHAAMDAVLGAAGLPDIGHRFPPGDPRFAGASSSVLAREVVAEVTFRGCAVVNLDLTLLAERPRIGPRVEAMRSAVAACFGIPAARVGLKATTHEGLGALGRGEGIACHAIALLRWRRDAS
jgi:2-C-methyl-D-erythritol 4-phosphate cytidylyltransferase/2-C-methyl-D-erythritol 2,4-cyclodiphosphate synthase